jgi:hypothetical protein
LTWMNQGPVSVRRLIALKERHITAIMRACL